jgi:hypothetical protein
MKKINILVIIFMLININIFAHKKEVHQYITKEAFKLLQMSFPSDLQGLNELEAYIGNNETEHDNWESIGDSKVVAGAWYEDEFDIVYHYGFFKRPNYNDLPQWAEEILWGTFANSKDAHTSITHFWDADNGENSQTHLTATLSGDIGQATWSFTIPENAMIKIRRYSNGSYEARWKNFELFHWDEAPYWGYGNDFLMPSLSDIYDRIGTINATKYMDYLFEMQDTNFPILDLSNMSSQSKNLIIYNTLGRMCHLLQDMSVPAHVHNTAHPGNKQTSFGVIAQYSDYYENNVMNYIENHKAWTAQEVFSERGEFINPYVYDDAIYYLMYFMNQISDHYADGKVNGDDIYDATIPGLTSIIPSLEEPTSTSEINDINCKSMYDVLMPYAIRNTAGLMYWFLIETEQIEPLPEPIILNGDVTLNGDSGILEETSIYFQRTGNNFTINPDTNGEYTHTFQYSDFGVYNISFSNEHYYPQTIQNWEINEYTTSLPNVTLNPILSNNLVIVDADPTNLQAFHKIQEAVNYLSNNQGGTIAILPGTYTGEGNKNISWYPWLLQDGLHINIRGLPSLQEDVIIDCEGSGVAFIFDDEMEGQGSCTYNENDIIENLVIRNARQGIVIQNGSPVIKNNIFEDCENNTSDQYLHGGAIYCSSSAIIEKNVFTNTEANESLYEIGLGGAIYAETESNETITIATNEFNNCRSFGGGAIYCTGTGNFEIKDNTFTQCSLIDGTFYPDEGLAVYCHTSTNEGEVEIFNNIFYNNIPYNNDGDVLFIQSNNLTFNNNTVINNNDCTGIRICTSNNAIVNNNLISNNAVGIYRQSYFAEPNITYTLASNNISNYQNCTPGIGCINNTSPELDNDFRPLWTSSQKSPCIDSGDPAETWDADGTPPDIGAVPAVNHRYDQVSLPPTTVDNGIKWLSFPALDVVRDSADIAENVLTDILDINILYQMRASDYRIYYSYGSWQNTDEQLTRTEGYKFKMLDSAQFDISGFKVPDNTKISLQSGSAGNWVGYWLEDTQSVFDALEGYLDDIYMVQAQHWSILKSGSTWLVTTDKGYSPTLSYADMAIIKCSTAIPKFTWNNSTVPEQPLEVAEPEYYIYSEQASYIPIFVELENSQKELPDEIGAFANGDCVGAAVVTDTLVMVPAYRSQGPIELEMYFADNKEKSSIANYRCYAAGNAAVVMEKLPDKLRAEAYVVSLDPASELIPNTLKFSLENYPNPFNPTTTIFYTQPQTGSVSLEIFNIKGQKVRTLVNSHQASGSYQAVWNGRDDGGRQAASGIYFYKLQTPGYTTMKKMLLLK